MIGREINKTELREKVGITTNELANLGRNEIVKMETLLKVCSVMKCEIDDIVEYSTKKEDQEMAKKSNQSIEPIIADIANGWLKDYKLDYKLEQETLNL